MEGCSPPPCHPPKLIQHELGRLTTQSPLRSFQSALLSHCPSHDRITELAGEFAISINTVKFHLRNLYEKLGFANRAQAIAFFYSGGKPDQPQPEAVTVKR